MRLTTMKHFTSPSKLSVAAAAIVGAAAAFFAVPAVVQSRSDVAPRAVTPRGPLAADELANIDLFKRTSPSVVHITSLAAQRDMFSMNVQQVSRARARALCGTTRVTSSPTFTSSKVPMVRR